MVVVLIDFILSIFRPPLFISPDGKYCNTPTWKRFPPETAQQIRLAIARDIAAIR